MDIDVLVVGSANLDLVTHLDRRPGPGETVLGGDLTRLPGGKGANQAWAAGRAGARTALLACMGSDEAAETLLASLTGAGVDTTGVHRVDAPTGTALIMVTPDGENSIVVCPGANAHLTPEVVANAAEVPAARVVVSQLEVPPETTVALARRVREAGVRLVLNAAPSAPLPDDVLAACDPLVVNETEAADLAGTTGSPAALAAALLDRGPRSIVITLGDRGSLVADGTTMQEVPAQSVQVVDTTGAGDSFVGALAAALAEGQSLAEAARRGTEAAARVVGQDGAQPV
ncbi:ribokinase [Mariniluteicoccus endophyticus]